MWLNGNRMVTVRIKRWEVRGAQRSYLLITMNHHHPLRFHTRHTQPEDGEKINAQGYNGVKCGANRWGQSSSLNSALLVSVNIKLVKVCKIYCLACGAPAVHATVQCSDNPSQQWQHLKENWNLDSAFKKTDRLLEKKCTGSQFH